MPWTPSESLPSLFSRIAARGQEAMVRRARERHSEAAERLSARGLGSGGSISKEVRDIYQEEFRSCGEGLIHETIGLVQNADGTLDPEAAAWVRAQLEPNFEALTQGTIRSLLENGQNEVLARVVEEVIGRVRAGLNRDLGIRLDKALLQPRKDRAAPAVDAALMDPLVPLRNRRAFDEDLSELLKSATPESPLALARLDVDHFKRVNDDHGDHAIGDQALIGIAKIAAGSAQGKGIAYRVGGDEFCLLLPNHTASEAVAVTERLRRTVNETPLTDASLKLSLSIGVAVFPGHGDSAEAFQKAADSAAYDAKNRGRNLVRVFGEPEPPTPGPREPERRQPEPGGLTDEERKRIRLDYFQQRIARCPRDGSLLEIEDVTGFGQRTNSLVVACPYCGLSEELD